MSMNQPLSGHGRGSARQQEVGKLKERYAWLESFTDDELGEVVFLEEGETMNPDDIYFDISDPERGAHHAQGGEVVPEGSRYVAKSRVPDAVWEKIVSPFR